MILSMILNAGLLPAMESFYIVSNGSMYVFHLCSFSLSQETYCQLCTVCTKATNDTHKTLPWFVWWGVVTKRPSGEGLPFRFLSRWNCTTVRVTSWEQLSWQGPLHQLPRFFCRCHIPQLTLNKVAGARDAAKVTDWGFKASVMISSGEDYIRRVCHVDGRWISLVCVCVEEKVKFKGDRDGCMHV